MNNSFLFFGKLCELLDEVKNDLESRSDFNCFEIEQGSELNQIIAMTTTGKNKALVLFSNLKQLSEANKIAPDSFTEGKAMGLLIAQERPMHPLLNKTDSNFCFIAEKEPLENIIATLEIFHAMGKLTDQAPKEKVIEAEWKSSKSSGPIVIDTNSRQRIERLGAIVEEQDLKTKELDENHRPLENKVIGGPSNSYWSRKKYKDPSLFSFTRSLAPPRDRSVFSFSRSLKSIKSSSIDRARSYVERHGIDGYTKEALDKCPDPIDLLEVKEDIYYESCCSLFKYLPMFAEMISKGYLKKPIMHRLIRLVLEKEFSCFVDFFTVEDEKLIVDSDDNINPPISDDIADWNVTVPEWEDSTFSKGKNKFIMPYSVGGQCQALAVAYFQDSKLNENMASIIEAMLFLCRGMYK